MKNKLIKFMLMIVCVITLLPHSVHAEGSSSPILPVASHGNVVKKMNLSDYTGGTTTDATLEIYEDGHTVIKSNSTIKQMQKIDNGWVMSAISAYYDTNPTLDITSLVYDSDTRLIATSMNGYNGFGRISKFKRRVKSSSPKLEYESGVLKEIDFSKTTPISEDGLDEMNDSTPEDKRIKFNWVFNFVGVDKIIFGDNWSKLKIAGIDGMFDWASVKEVVGFEKLDIQPTTATNTFNYAFIDKIDVTKMDLTRLNSAHSMFAGSNVPVKDLFSRQHVKPFDAQYMFALYNSNEPLDVSGLDLSGGGNFHSIFEGLQVPSFKFDLSNGKGIYTRAFARIGVALDISKLPRVTTATTSTENYNYREMLEANHDAWEVHLTSIDLSDYTTDILNDTSILKGQSGLQVIKTSVNTKLPADGFGLASSYSSYTIFNKYDTGFTPRYTGRWVLKYRSDGSLIPEEDRKYATTCTEFNNTDGYWIRETVAKDMEPNLSGGRVYETEDSKWTINADGTMTYNMKVMDRKEKHYIVEEENPNYIRTDSTQTINGNKVSIAEVGDRNTTATVINKYTNTTNTETRTLTIRKNVDVEDSTQFVFDITVHHENLSGIKKINNILFKDGVGTVTLMGNESIKLELPKGTQYTITERSVKNWTLTSQENTTGTLDLNTEAVFTNTRDTFPNVSDNTTELNIEKNVPESYTGYNGDNGFDFEVTLSGLVPNTDYEYEQYGARRDFTSDEHGLAKLNLNVSKTTPVKIIAEGLNQFKYSIREKTAETGTGYTYTPSIQVFEDSSLIDNVGGKKGEDLISKTYTAKTGKVNRAVVTNDISDLYQLSVSKMVENSDTTEPFDFTISIRGLKENDKVRYFVYGNDDAKTVKSTGEYTDINLKLANNGGVDVYDIPMYAQVSVIEHANTKGFISNYQDMSGYKTDNTTVGKEMATPYISGSRDNSYVSYTFYNSKVQTFKTSKTVTGTQGNKDELFDFTAKLVAEDDSTYTGDVTLVDKVGKKEVLHPNADGLYEFRMKHGDIIQFSGFSSTIKSVELTEKENSYVTTMAADNNVVEDKTITVDITGDAIKEIKVHNSLGFDVPTGISLPLGGLLLFVGLGVIYIVKKGKREK